MSDFWTMALTVCPLVFLASAIDAIAGGGGLISLPAYLLTGMTTPMAGGTNKMSASIGTLTALVKYIRGGKIAWRPALFAALGALPGAWLGVQQLVRIDDQAARMISLCVLPVMALLSFIRIPRLKGISQGAAKGSLICFFIGLCIGFYDGFLGPGTGSLLIILFGALLNMEAVTASGSAKLVNLSSNLAALAAHMFRGNAYYLLALPAMACSIAGGYFGAFLALKVGAKFVRYVMLSVVLVLIIRVIVISF